MPAPSAPTLETVRTAAARLLQFAIVLAGAPLSAADASSSGLEFFENRIRPVLAEHCYQCHSAGAAKIGGSLIMDTKEDFLKGGIDGPVVVPGDPDASLLIQAVRYDHPERQMPPPKSGGQKLPAIAITDLTAWVKMGAP
jgi:mono/diheme cytochrome c family protein